MSLRNVVGSAPVKETCGATVDGEICGSRSEMPRYSMETGETKENRQADGRRRRNVTELSRVTRDRLDTSENGVRWEAVEHRCVAKWGSEVAEDTCLRRMWRYSRQRRGVSAKCGGICSG